ncbi:lipopolysaccharide export system permease protein [Rhodovulum bhavnagarense]|uniref:Lipopolysaccharide export system permease protein n=2 Tax=Rhodovulum bhavnagarense TaxID=992286 RepID=A0A4R2RVU5_9RHOB|nr:lipopolysaccharide export system permease protein [Rhodovulum bhavnagarense]
MLSQLTILFSFFALVLVSIYWLNQAVKLFEQLIGDGQSALVFLEFTALGLPNIIRLVLPLAAFAGTIQVMNRLTNESELVVMQAVGCGPWRLARPVLVFGAIVALIASVLTHALVPASQAQLSERSNEISRDITARFMSEGQFLHPAPGITFYIREITPAGELRDMFLSDARREDRRTTYTAKRALLVESETGPKLVMFDGMAQVLIHETRRLSTAGFDDFTYDIGALLAARVPQPQRLRVQSTLTLLDPPHALLRATGATRAEALQEAHARFSAPLLAVAGALIGYGALLLGGFSRFGVGRQIALAVVLLIGVHLVDNSAADMARRDASLWMVSYLAPGLGIAMGALLITLSGRRRRLPGETRA